MVKFYQWSGNDSNITTDDDKLKQRRKQMNVLNNKIEGSIANEIKKPVTGIGWKGEEAIQFSYYLGSMENIVTLTPKAAKELMLSLVDLLTK